MTPSQIEACGNRNELLKADITAGNQITVSRVSRACTDIDNLLDALETMTERARLEREAQVALRKQLADEKRLKADAMREVSVLRDKLSKAQILLEDVNPADLSAKERAYLKDIRKDG